MTCGSAPMNRESTSAQEKPAIEHRNVCCAQLQSSSVVVNRPIRLLTFTTLFPNSTQPSHGIFVENRLLHLIESGKAVSTVIAPVPYLPSVLRGLGRWGHYRSIKERELRHGITVYHPRFLAIP